MKRIDVINIMKEYKEYQRRLQFVHERIPYYSIGKPNTNSLEWERFRKLEREYEEWLQGEIDKQ